MRAHHTSHRPRTSSRQLLAVVLLLAAGCDGIADRPVADGGALDQTCGCSGTDASPAAGTATVSGVFWDSEHDSPNVGTAICLVLDGKKTKRCSMTNTSGLYALDVPTNTPLFLDYQRPGWEHAILSLQLSGSLNLCRMVVWSDAQAKTYYAAAKVAYPPTTRGNLLVICYPGTTTTIAPKSANGPIYDNKSGQLDPTLSQSEGGHALFFDLAPGTYSVTCAHPSKTCWPLTGWPAPAGAKVPVIAGAYSSVLFACE